MQSFVPATNKLEAVARISALTQSGPETLGPGSKERKSVVVNLATGLGLAISIDGTKQEIASRIASALGTHWTDKCESVGQTITLFGLNLLLEKSTRYLEAHGQLSGQKKTSSISDEAEKISLVIINELSKNTGSVWDGRMCLEEMKSAGSSQWRQTEWQGFYFEYKALPALVTELGGGPVKIQNTKFDYQFHKVWDLKAHSIFGSTGRQKQNHISQLNDKLSMDLAIANGGLGLIVLSGIPSYSDVEFTKWHKQIRGGGQEEPRKLLKNSFTPTYIDAFFIPNEDELSKAISEKKIIDFKQGKQQNGAPRASKYSINLLKSRGSDLQVYGASIR